MNITRVTTPAHDEIVRPTSPTYGEIAKRAHEIWENSGRPEGHDVGHWLEAERELRTERAQAQRPDTEPGALSSHSGLSPTPSINQPEARRR